MEILGKLCFARLKLNLKTEDRFKLKTKLSEPPAGAVRRAQSLCHVYYDEFFGSPQKNFANERGFDFLDGRTDRQTDRQTDRRTGIL